MKYCTSKSAQLIVALEYLWGHLTHKSIETFISQHAVSWGSESLSINLTWGYKHPLTVKVTDLNLLDSSSEIAYTYVVEQNAVGAAPMLTRLKAPPLGIHMVSLEAMNDEYCKYIRNIVDNDSMSYAAITYDEVNVHFPRQLLESICEYYTSPSKTDYQVSPTSKMHLRTIAKAS